MASGKAGAVHSGDDAAFGLGAGKLAHTVSAEGRSAGAVYVVVNTKILDDKRRKRILQNIFCESNFRGAQEIWPTRNIFVGRN
jgi:hypothetical protein